MLKTARFALPLSLLATSLVACGGSSSSTPPTDITEARSSKPRDTAPADDNVAALADANNAFAKDLYGKLAAQNANGNLFFSPYSVSVALSMAYAGAHGQTATEMAKTLHVDGLAPADAFTAFDSLDLALASRGQVTDSTGAPVDAFTLNVVDAAFGDPTFHFQPTYLDTLAVDYGAGVKLLDFLHDPDGSRGKINAWVASQTNDKIPTLLQPGTIDDSTRYVLVDAIYFKATWGTQFDPSKTANAAFTTLGGDAVQVPTMTLRASDAEMPYTHADDYDAVVLPYLDGRVAMDVIVPAAGKFGDVESKVDGAFLATVEAGEMAEPTSLRMPKFQIAGDSVSLASILQSLGMQQAFTNGADFTALAEEPTKIKDVIHRAFVSVDEQGTEAAAATAVVGVGASIALKTFSLAIDRPFLIFVRDLPTKTTIFAGRVVDPR